MKTLDRVLQLQQAGRQRRVFVTQPEAPARYPLLVMLMDAPGVRPELEAMARQFTVAGVAVALPDLYWRTADAPLTAGDRVAMYRHMNALTAPQVIDDVTAVRAALRPEPQIDVGALGLIGYCMSGPHALHAAAALGPHARMVAAVHGVRLFCAASTSAHRSLAAIHGEIYIACGGRDPWTPAPVVDGLAQALAASGARFRLDRFAAAQHGFSFPERPAWHEPSARALAVQIRSLIGRTLPRPAELE